MILWRDPWILDHIDAKNQLAYILQSSGRKNIMHACTYAWKDAREDLDTPIITTRDRRKAAEENHKISISHPALHNLLHLFFVRGLFE